MLRNASGRPSALGEVDAALGEPVAPDAVGEEPVGEALVVELERGARGRPRAPGRTSTPSGASSAAGARPGQPEDRLGRAARVEAVVLEQDPPGRVPRPHASRRSVCRPCSTAIARRPRAARSRALAAVAGRDERPEEVGVRESPLGTSTPPKPTTCPSSSATNSVSSGRLVPVRELALELVRVAQSGFPTCSSGRVSARRESSSTAELSSLRKLRRLSATEDARGDARVVEPGDPGEDEGDEQRPPGDVVGDAPPAASPPRPAATACAQVFSLPRSRAPMTTPRSSAASRRPVHEELARDDRGDHPAGKHVARRA